MNKKYKFILLLLIVIFAISSFFIIKEILESKKQNDIYDDLQQIVTKNDKNDNVIKNNEKKTPKDNYNLKNIKNINSDVVGWIKIDNTTINYPIVKTTDNEFYLKKDIYKQYDQCGSIFMDYKNNKDFTDKNNVLYGHHIKSGIMFADLLKIYNNELGKDVNIYVYTPTMERKYKVFSSYKSEPEDYAINTSITENEYNEFINELKNRSQTDYGISPNESSQILTLSTCDNTGKKRILVHAKLDEIYSFK